MAADGSGATPGVAPITLPKTVQDLDGFGGGCCGRNHALVDVFGWTDLIGDGLLDFVVG